MRPNFFIVGAPKSGTTSLYHYLDQHPQIFMSPIKEPSYFASEMRPEKLAAEYRNHPALDSAELERYLKGPRLEKRGGLISTWQDYLKLFDSATREIAIGEASVCYLWSPTAAQNIARCTPEAKIIAVLRHPADRAWSEYLSSVANGYVTGSFREQIDACLAPHAEEFSPIYPFLEFGMYCRQVKTFLKLFPRENIRIYFYQDGHSSIVSDLFRFLNVDPAFSVDLSRKYLDSSTAETPMALFRILRKNNLWEPLRKLAPKSVRPFFRRLAFRKSAIPVMNKEDRQFLCEYYKEDVLQLSHLLNRDLTSWLV
jgi:hypothetical protein